MKINEEGKYFRIRTALTWHTKTLYIIKCSSPPIRKMIPQIEDKVPFQPSGENWLLSNSIILNSYKEA
ncbi:MULTISPECIES: hypothetical protein [Methanosarcina]|uniref:Uncharacterized protein n=2 Tax=Methanosarcina barkeri TaxID=2208 RepID=A0A0E3QZD1_METBA|nr:MULTISPECIES: hypothetical protein [Methanosarcina]AKB56317.1 hypothetical protein MSBRM_3319 [Methanosarcina barkeri MS]AKB59789.1 hypothetical protein MSBR2_3273 [Methanosarcina barkeri 227]OED03295.1 hypothetical protein A9239_13780 [Methanosarcina sp. A14]